MAPPMLRNQIVPRTWILQQQKLFPNDESYDLDDFERYDINNEYYVYLPGGAQRRAARSNQHLESRSRLVL